MSAINPVPAMNAFNNPGQCQACKSMRQTTPVTFHRNIGMLFARQTKILQGNLCKTCIRKHYWEFMGKNLMLGPWGTISLFVTPIYMVTNTVSYVKALRNLQGAIE
jgi:hypothetical protein